MECVSSLFCGIQNPQLFNEAGYVAFWFYCLFTSPDSYSVLFSGSSRKWRKQIPKTSGPGGLEIWVLNLGLVWSSHVLSLGHCVKWEYCNVICPAYALHLCPGSLWWSNKIVDVTVVCTKWYKKRMTSSSMTCGEWGGRCSWAGAADGTPVRTGSLQLVCGSGLPLPPPGLSYPLVHSL